MKGMYGVLVYGERRRLKRTVDGAPKRLRLGLYMPLSRKFEKVPMYFEICIKIKHGKKGRLWPFSSPRIAGSCRNRLHKSRLLRSIFARLTSFLVWYFFFGFCFFFCKIFCRRMHYHSQVDSTGFWSTSAMASPENLTSYAIFY